MNKQVLKTSAALPQSVEAEIGVLGALLVEEEVAGEVIPTLDQSYFIIPAHQTIYEVIALLYDSSKPLDLVAVQEELKKRGMLEDVGADYLVSLIEAVPSAGNVEFYANVVKEKAILRQLNKAGEEIAILAKNGQMEVEALLDKAEQLVFEVTQKKITNEPRHIYDLLLNIFSEIEASNAGLSPGISTGFADLDGLVSGLQEATLNILAARPSMGKTSFALNIADNIGVRQGLGVLIFSLEMAKEQLAQNMICSRARVSPHKLKTHNVDQKVYLELTTEAGIFAQAPIFIDDTPALSIRELRAKARRFKTRHDIRLIIIDYVQLMEGSQGKRSENRQQEISHISRSLKGIARELQVPIIALSQLNRSVDARDDHRPRMSDLRESGALEQDADVIIFLYRDEYYNKDSTDAGIAEIIVAKNRTGPTGNVKLRFFKEFMRFMALSYQRV